MIHHLMTSFVKLTLLTLLEQIVEHPGANHSRSSLRPSTKSGINFLNNLCNSMVTFLFKVAAALNFGPNAEERRKTIGRCSSKDQSALYRKSEMRRIKLKGNSTRICGFSLFERGLSSDCARCEGDNKISKIRKKSCLILQMQMNNFPLHGRSMTRWKRFSKRKLQ